MIKDDFIKKVLITMFVFLFIFTIVMIIIFVKTGNIPDTLIVAVFGACGLIKNAKEKQRTARMVHGLINEESAHDDDFEEEVVD